MAKLIGAFCLNVPAMPWRMMTVLKMDEGIKRQIVFVLADDNELMRAALRDEDFEEENKAMNGELIARHEQIIAKVKKGLTLSAQDLRLIHDANDIHLNDVANFNEHHREAVRLEEWLKRKRGRAKDGRKGKGAGAGLNPFNFDPLHRNREEGRYT